MSYNVIITTETRLTLDELAEGVASALSASDELGRTWTAETGQWHGMTLRLHDAALFMSWVRYGSTDRVRISGDYPGDGYDNHYGLDKTEITVATDRGTQVIAREITRRVLPAYWRNLATVTERIIREEQRQAKRDATVARLAELPGIDTPDGTTEAIYFYHPDWRTAGYPHPAGLYRGTVSVEDDGDDVKFDITGVPIEKALRMLRILLEDEPDPDDIDCEDGGS